MDITEFVRVVRTFADAPADLDVSRGTLIVQVRDELIEATIRMREGRLLIEEGGNEVTGERWIIDRLARVPLLAERILSYVSSEQFFIVPQGILLDQPDQSPQDEELRVGNAMETAGDVLGRRPAGATSILYLTSDAGEGKTTLISELARSQAEAYRRKETDWLLIPISLGGRTFLRFDDVVIGALV